MASRRKKFEDDVTIAENLIKDQDWQIEDFTVSDSSLTFTLNKDESRNKFSIVTSDDYPEHSIVYKEGKTDCPSFSNETIPILMENIVNGMEFHSKTQDVDISQNKPISRSVSMDSDGSSYADCASNIDDMEDDNEEDMDDYYEEDDDDDDMSVDTALNPMLALDMEHLESFSDDSDVLSYRLLDSIDEIDVELNVPLAKYLEKEIAEAWGLNRDEPLVVRLHLSLTSYLDTPKPPKIEAFQPTKKEKCGIGSQIRKILESFLSEQWQRNSNDQLSKLHKFRDLTSSINSEDNPEVSGSAGPVLIDDRDLAKIMEMGFSTEQARNALILHHGDVVQATNDLFANSDREKMEQAPVSTYPPKKVEEEKLVNPKCTMRQTSHPPNPVLRKIKKGFGRQCSVRATKQANKTGNTDLTLVPSSTWLGKNAKRIPSLDNGFLVQIYQYICQRIPTLNEYCVVCDEPHVFQNGAMLKPAVCSRELCVFAFQTLGVMSDAAEDIATGAEVVDLLMAMTRAACKSNRKRVIFDPYPTVVDPTNGRELAFNPKNKDYNKVEAAIDAIIPMQDMTRLGGSKMRKTLDEANLLAYPLLQWIITSNRSHIVKLPLEKQISFMRTPHQFLLLSSPPAKEASFRESKQKYGSTFAFHGSGIENWHSIIREGLVVASGTNKQVNGAAYGKGIYLSPCANVSFGYSRMGYGGHKVNTKQDSKSRFLSSENITCIALCEVITSPDLKKSGNIWVSPKNEYVCTRFFCVYEDGQVGDSDINTQDDKYKKEIFKAVGYRM